jgi:hypothetical protein
MDEEISHPGGAFPPALKPPDALPDRASGDVNAGFSALR